MTKSDLREIAQRPLFLAAVLLCFLAAPVLPARAAIVQYTNRQEWEAAVRDFAVVPYTNVTPAFNRSIDVGLVTILPTTGSTVAWVGVSAGTSGSLKLSGSGTTAPWFRWRVTIDDGNVSAVGFDTSNSGHTGMYGSWLTHDGGTISYSWPGNYPSETRGFVGYVDSGGQKTISGFSFGSTGSCNFTGGGVERICLSQPPRPRGAVLIVR